MAKCVAQLHFDFYHNKEVVADFKGGEISSDAGLLALKELADRLGWLRDAAGLLSDARDPNRTTHGTLTLLEQRIFGLIAGYEDANDHDRMRHDPILKLVAGRCPEEESLASQPTLSRFENSVAARDVARVNRLLVGHVIAQHKRRKSKRIILDIDPTDDPCHGRQQLSLFNGFYDQYMYFPLLVFDRATGLLAGVRLRAGNVHGAHRALQLLGPIVSALRAALPSREIIIRGDAGLAVPELYRFCERRGLEYILGIPSNRVFKERTQWALKWLSARLEKTGRPRRWVGGFKHRAGSWRRTRRILYKAEVNPEGTNRRFVVTNMKGLPVHLYPFYSGRGTAETFIDELKNALKADRLSCSRFVANAFRLAMFAFSYNLLRVYHGLLKDTALEGASIETIRSRLVKIGARVRSTSRRVWVHLAGGWPFREVLELVMSRIKALAHPPPLPAAS